MKDRIVVLDTCLKEIKKFPEQVIKDILELAVRLGDGEQFNMPLSRSMPSIGKGVKELRIKDKTGAYRVIYYFKTDSGQVYFLHAFKKKAQKTPEKNLKLASKRLRSIK